MKKLFRFFILLSFLFFGKSLSAQNIFKIGPSLMYSWSWFDDKLYLNFGVDVSYEFAIGKKSSIDIGAIFHYGDHKSIFDQNILRKNYFIGVHTEYRRYFKNRINGGYIGLGGDVQFYLADFEAPPGEHPGKEGGLEVNTGISFGYLSPVDKESLNFSFARDLYINPYVYIGFNAFDYNEYPIHARLGINIGF